MDTGNEDLRDDEMSFEDLIKSEDEEEPTPGTLSIIEDDYDDEADAEEDVEYDEENEEEEEEFEVITEESAPKQKDEKRLTLAPSESKKFQGPPTLLNNVLQNKVVASSSTLIKIAPRTSTTTVTSPPSSTITTAKTPNGKIIYLQRSGGNKVPVRVPTSMAANTTTTNNQSKQIAIHVIRTPEGNLVPFKSGKNINIPNSIMAGNKVVASSSGGTSGHIVMKGPIKSVGQSNSRAIGSTIISSLDDRKPKVQQILTTKSLLTSSSNGSGKVMVQNTPGTPRQIMVSGNMIKLSPNTSGGQLQAVQIPGKPGLQYVRVLNSSQGITQKSSPSESTTTQRYTVVRQPNNKQSIIVKSPMTDKERQKVITTVPTFRKINDVMVRTQDSSNQGSVLKTQRISQINTQINKICGTLSDSKSDTSSSKYVVVPQSLIRTSVTSTNQKISQQRQSLQETKTVEPLQPAKKLYSILRPTTIDLSAPQYRMKAKVEPVASKFKTESKAKPVPVALLSSATTGRSASRVASPPPSDDSSNVGIRRKHCNCTKSQCLKLYCDCFANGEFCQDCNCKDCLNNLDNEDDRQKAIRVCLERNPNSFKPKITAATKESDQRLHNKGCNCKRSGCLKNYCECYEAKISCSSNCKCIGCRNIDDHPDLDMDTKKVPSNNNLNNRPKRKYEDMQRPRASHSQYASSIAAEPPAVLPNTTATTACGPPAEKQPCNFITQEVVDATIQCLIAQADECEKSEVTPYQTEKMIMEELGSNQIKAIFAVATAAKNLLTRFLSSRQIQTYKNAV